MDTDGRGRGLPARGSTVRLLDATTFDCCGPRVTWTAARKETEDVERASRICWAGHRPAADWARRREQDGRGRGTGIQTAGLGSGHGTDRAAKPERTAETQPTGGAGNGHGSTADAILRRWVAATLRRPRLFPARTAGISPLPPELHLSRGQHSDQSPMQHHPLDHDPHRQFDPMSNIPIMPPINFPPDRTLDRRMSVPDNLNPSSNPAGPTRVLRSRSRPPSRQMRSQEASEEPTSAPSPPGLPRTLAQHHTPALPSFVFPTNSQNGRGGRR